MNEEFQAAKELYYLTCEMHAELWRLERMSQAYSRFEILQLKTGMLSSQTDAILRKAKPYIAAESALPAELEGELDRAACGLASELIRVEEMRQSDTRVADFTVESRLFTRMDEVRARMEELLSQAIATALLEPRMPSALYSCPLWAVTSSLNQSVAGKNC